MGVSQLEERPLGSVGHVSTFGLARLVPGACHLGASRAEQVGRREKPAEVLRRADRTHTLLKGGGHSSVPATAIQKKHTLWRQIFQFQEKPEMRIFM